jgi:hypothetical protein
MSKIQMKKDKDCKNSVRYKAEGGPIKTIYVERGWKNKMPSNIKITLE